MAKSKLLTASIAIALIAGSFGAAQAAPAAKEHKTAIEKKCMKQNPNDHQAYLTCVENKGKPASDASGQANQAQPANPNTSSQSK